MLDHRVIEKAPLVVALPLRIRAPSSLRLIMHLAPRDLALSLSYTYSNVDLYLATLVMASKIQDLPRSTVLITG